jgi:hypothetical protein
MIDDMTNEDHEYDRQCRCNNCQAFEIQLQKAIAHEDNGYCLTGGPNNIQRSEIGFLSTIGRNRKVS